MTELYIIIWKFQLENLDMNNGKVNVYDQEIHRVRTGLKST